MKITIAKTAGFCMGVRRAVEMSLDAANTTAHPICSFGPLIHNPQVLKLLAERGVSVIEEIPADGKGAVLIRAHGVPPETKAALAQAGYSVIDATCPRVIKVQTIIRTHAVRGYAVIIVGDDDHPEVKGLLGYAGAEGHVVDCMAELESLPPFEKAIIVAQTTQNFIFFDTVKKWASENHPHYKVFNTICDSTEKRQAEVRHLSRSVDAMIVVGGYNSGNTQRLAEVAQEEGKPAYHIETEADIDESLLTSARHVGITAGASTPNWIINRVYRSLETLPLKKGFRWRRYFFGLQRFLLFSNLYIAIGAGCLSYAAVKLQGIPQGGKAILMACLYIFSMHTFNHLTGRHSDRYNDPDRAVFYEAHKKLLTFLALLAGSVGLLVALEMGPLSFGLLFAMSIFGALYNVRILPRLRKNSGNSAFKDIPGSKTVLIVMAWGFVAAVLPALGILHAINAATVVAFLWICGIVFVRTAFFDILDMQGDRIVGRETIPLLFGEKRTRRLLKRTASGLTIFMVAASLFKSIGVAGVLLSLVPAILLGIILARERIALPSGMRLVFLIESTFIFAGAISLLI